jgi:hypothetical protein
MGKLLRPSAGAVVGWNLLAVRCRTLVGALRARARLALLAVLLLAGCRNEQWLVGDSYVRQMAPYWVHTGCPIHDLSRSGRRAAEVLAFDVERIEEEVAAMEPGSTPQVFLSAGVIDEVLWGPELAGSIVTELAERILAIHPELELYHLDYSPIQSWEFWSYTPVAEIERWHRVSFQETLDSEISSDGIHLELSGYVERLLVLSLRYPRIVCWGERWRQARSGEKEREEG